MPILNNNERGLNTVTVKQWLEELAGNNTSNEQDDRKLQNLLHRVNFPSAICTCGIAYLEGKGTLEFPPMPIQSVARMLIDVINRQAIS